MFFRQLVVSTLALTSQEAMAKPLVAEPVVKPRIVQSRAIMNISSPLELKNITRVALPTLATRDVINRDVAVRGESGVSTYVEGRSSADASVVMGGLVTAAYGLAGTVCILGGLATAGAVCWASMVYAGIVTMFERGVQLGKLVMGIGEGSILAGRALLKTASALLIYWATIE